MRLPANSISLEEASANAVCAWVKHAVTLQKAYENPNLSRAVTRLDTPARVTFVKLLRGRWCLVASSNTSVSELSVWKILSPSVCSFRARIYLRAPVLDGLLDDGGYYIRFAVTIGASWVINTSFFTSVYLLSICRQPSINIFEITEGSGSVIMLHQCAEIAGASRLLYFKGSDVAFACWHGDDTYPLIKNWITGHTIQLGFPRGVACRDLCPFPVVCLLEPILLTI